MKPAAWPLTLLSAFALGAPRAIYAAPPATPAGWKDALHPTQGEAAAVGGTSAGCLKGGVELPASGEGFRVMKPERRRAFGHPELVATVQSFAAKLKAAGMGPLGVGDLS